MSKTILQQHDKASGYFFKIVMNERAKPSFTAIAKTKPFVAQGVLDEPWGDDVWFEFGNTPLSALEKLKASL